MTAAVPHRRTRQRAAIAAVLSEVPGFQTAQQLHELLADRGEAVALATIYRHLQAMADRGEIDVIRTPEGQCAYRRCTHPEHHHHHLVCRRCGHTVEIESGSVESLLGALAAEHGFTSVAHELELFGICSRCSATSGADS